MPRRTRRDLSPRPLRRAATDPWQKKVEEGGHRLRSGKRYVPD